MEEKLVTKVEDLMVRDVVTADAMTPLLEALELMIEKSVKSLVIPPKKDSDAFGILTFSDIAKKALAENERMEMLNVYDLMSKPCYTVRSGLDIRHAAKIMTNLNISRMIVTRGPRLVGIVSLTDLVYSLVVKSK